jgi:hypothetical protein
MGRSAKRAGWLCCLAIALTASASALMAPEYYQKARAEAPYHVQVEIALVSAPEEGPGDCTVEGTVVEVFKDATGKLKKGTPVSFAVACYNEADRLPIGGVMWTKADALQQAKYIEVYLVDAAEGFDVALWQSKIIAAPSAQPQFPVD